MRKVYKNAKTEADQRRIVGVLCGAWKCGWASMTDFSEIDYALVKGSKILSMVEPVSQEEVEKQREIMALVEIKTRANERERYLTYFVSAHKIEYGMRWEKTFGVPFILVVEFTDGIYWVRPSEAPFHVEMGGRKDRNDKADIEIMAHFNAGMMKRLRVPEMAA